MFHYRESFSARPLNRPFEVASRSPRALGCAKDFTTVPSNVSNGRFSAN